MDRSARTGVSAQADASSEVAKVLSSMQGTPKLIGGLLYGSGLRLMEALTLRVKDIDFARNDILVRNAKGQKDRHTVLPESLKVAWESTLNRFVNSTRAISRRVLGVRRCRTRCR